MSNTYRRTLTSLVLTLAVAFTLNAQAETDIYELPKSEIVMNRSYSVHKEFGVHAGILPIGALGKYASLGLNYVYFPTESQGWEVIHLQYAIDMPSKLKSELKKSPWDATSADLPTLQYMATTSYVFSPFYSKATLFNSRLVHTQLLFSLGGGIAKFVDSQSFIFDLGVAQRFFLSPDASLKVDIRYYPIFSDVPLAKTQMALLLSYSWNLR